MARQVADGVAGVVEHVDVFAGVERHPDGGARHPIGVGDPDEGEVAGVLIEVPGVGAQVVAHQQRAVVR